MYTLKSDDETEIVRKNPDTGLGHSHIGRFTESMRFYLRYKPSRTKREELRKLMENPDTKYYFMLIMAMALWGMSWVSKDVAVGLASPMTVGFFRYLFASVSFFIFMTATGEPPHRRFKREDLKSLILVGGLGIFAFEVMELTGLVYTTSAQGAIIDGIQPITIAFFAGLILHEQLPRKWQYSGLVLGFLGIVIVVGVQYLLVLNLDHLLGNIILVLATCIWALYSVAGRKIMEKMPSLNLVAGASFVGLALFGVFASLEGFWLQPAMTEPAFWLNTVFLGAVVTFLSYLLYFEAVRNIGVTRSGIFLSLVPIFGTLLSAWLLSEVIYWTFLAGLACVTVAIFIVNYPSAQNEPTPPIQ
ncbi:DMT family transporter [Candidatus Thorarchaeota archaeon]|nr:MAG: DMT family transporter [Candidatus Thorarchaeota archaeon]